MIHPHRQLDMTCMTRTSSEAIPTWCILFAGCAPIVEERAQRWVIETAVGGVEERVESEWVRYLLDRESFYFWSR